jgi:hypothetical protein
VFPYFEDYKGEAYVGDNLLMAYPDVVPEEGLTL